MTFQSCQLTYPRNDRRRLIYKGLMNLANFVLSQSSKVLNELIDKHVKCKPLMRIFNVKKIENGCLS